MKRSILTLVGGLLAGLVGAQNTVALTETAAVERALAQHPLLEKNRLQVQQAKTLTGSARLLAPADFTAETPSLLMGPDNVTLWTTIGVQQSFYQPRVYRQNEAVLAQKVRVAEAEQAISAYDIVLQTKQLYQNVVFQTEKVRFLTQQDSIFQKLVHLAEVEFRVGKITALEKLNLESFYKQIQLVLRGGILEQQAAESALSVFLQQPCTVADTFRKLPLPLATERSNLPVLAFSQQQIGLQKALLAQQELQTLAQWTLGISQFVFNRPVPPVLRFGVSLPLSKKGYRALNQGRALEVKMAEKEAEMIAFNLNNAYNAAQNKLKQSTEMLNYYENTGRAQAQNILSGAQKTYQAGAISTFEYLMSIRQAYDIELAYLEALQNYNQAVLQWSYFMNKN